MGSLPAGKSQLKLAKGSTFSRVARLAAHRGHCLATILVVLSSSPKYFTMMIFLLHVVMHSPTNQSTSRPDIHGWVGWRDSAFQGGALLIRLQLRNLRLGAPATLCSQRLRRHMIDDRQAKSF